MKTGKNGKRPVKECNELVQNKIILVETIIILVISIVIFGVAIVGNSDLHFNVIESAVGILSIAVAMVIGYQIINALEIKNEIKGQNDRIEKYEEETSAAIAGGLTRIESEMKKITEEYNILTSRSCIVGE